MRLPSASFEENLDLLREIDRFIDKQPSYFECEGYDYEDYQNALSAATIAYCDQALRDKANLERSKPLTLEQVKKLAGKEPVFCVDIEEDLPFGTSREWAVEKVHEKLIHDYVWRFENYGKTWLAYRHPPKEADANADSNSSKAE